MKHGLRITNGRVVELIESIPLAIVARNTNATSPEHAIIFVGAVPYTLWQSAYRRMPEHIRGQSLRLRGIGDSICVAFTGTRKDVAAISAALRYAGIETSVQDFVRDPIEVIAQIRETRRRA